MNRFCLILVAAVVLLTLGGHDALAADDGSTDTLSVYLHAHRLPLVEARMLTGDRGERSVLLYGFVATDYGKRDAEDQARDFLDDPDISIINRIKVRPELLTLGRPANDYNSETGTQPTSAENDSDSADHTATQTQDFPDVIGSSEDYSNQERDAELLMSNGAAVGGIPLALAILGSGAVFPPVIPDPIYYNRIPPGFGPPRSVVFPPPSVVSFLLRSPPGRHRCFRPRAVHRPLAAQSTRDLVDTRGLVSPLMAGLTVVALEVEGGSAAAAGSAEVSAAEQDSVAGSAAITEPFHL